MLAPPAEQNCAPIDHPLFLVFDDVIAQHQGRDRFYQQDSIQFTFDGFLRGFAFSAAILGDGEQYLYRNRWFEQRFNKVLDPEVVPRHYYVLDSAQAVEERKYIEGIYGVDLTDSKVRGYEIAIPVRDYIYGDDESANLTLESGQTFWIGFMLNDVDMLGVDDQRPMVWPSTFGMFAVAEKGAVAVFE